jgi:hypothetical protein
MMSRVIAWFSCGIPSAVNAKICVDEYDAEVIYCNTSRNEHADNMRFARDVEKWIGKKVTFIENKKFQTVEQVFDARKFMSSPWGAPCTVELKKVPRLEYQHIDDIHAWGYHIGEEDRAKSFEKNNHDLKIIWPLIEKGITKDDCKAIIHSAGIEEPAMYKLGFDHNNCIGCVKATSPKYWNKIRQHFPATFELRAKQSREIGCKLTKVSGERIYLDELAADNQEDLFEDISCGPQCINTAGDKYEAA